MRQLWDLWSQWWSGSSLTGSQLWGLQLTYWARIGKLLQFMAGLTVILDLIGPEPLRAFGKRLLRVPWARGFSSGAEKVAVVTFVTTLLAYIALWVLMFVSEFVAPVERFFAQLLTPLWTAGRWIDQRPWLLPLLILGFFSFLALSSVVHKRLWPQDDTTKTRKELRGELDLALFVTPVALIAAIAVGLLLLPWLIFIYGLCVPLSRGIGWLLDRHRPAHPARWIALVLFIVGFHFDLLAS
ncbi:hypothetical protein AB0C27_10820 [Nonomuraea sp. NPDC048882]|uniref:hypothetical protein n=1 Tax=Nonomuraea sp. NPDC048882 TaxID=3154347 RepID=UPI003411EFD8